MLVMNDSYDVLIAGCGPGGSSAASYLAKAGKRVLVLEREVFPRFHIGESLLPCNMPIFRELGLLPAIEAARFPRKRAARFALDNGVPSTRYAFRPGRFLAENGAFSVERSIFDHILLKNTRALGADVREGWTVLKTAANADGVTVEAKDAEGAPHQFRAKFLIDATGRSNLTGNQESQRVIHPNHKKLAVFYHFTGVLLDPGEAAGDTVIVRLENKWFWIIPVSPEKTSVGLVIDKEEFARAGGAPGDVFQRWVDASEVMKRRLKDARAAGEIRTTSDFSYYNRRLVSERTVRIGDAAGFMDPIFSAGVYLAMWSGKLAAESAGKVLAGGGDGRAEFERLEKRVRSALALYWRMVENYYTTPFMEIFLHPSDHAGLRDTIIAVLAGELEPRWSVRLRMAYFFFLVRLQSRLAIVPRLQFNRVRAVRPAKALASP